MKEHVEQGKVSETGVNEAVRRVLTVKFARGLFDRPYTDESHWQTAFLQPDALALAREAAAKSCVLLKNEGDALPISKQAKKLALIGPFADDAGELLGCWHSRGHTNDVVSLAAGIRAKLSDGSQLAVARGCTIIEDGEDRRPMGVFLPITGQITGSNEIAEAVAVAKAADVVVMSLGEPRDWSGENASRSDARTSGPANGTF